MTGGGSGGHITPILAVARELKDINPDVQVVYIGQKGDKLFDVASGHKAVDVSYAVSAGKLRRYHGEGLKQLLDFKTMALNVRDAFRVVAGILQSLRLLRKVRPDIIFVKGGFVGVPVGLAAAALKIPYITHDSDALPGLANRIIARWAAKHAVALPAEVYNYPVAKTVTVGVPVTADYQFVTPALQQEYRKQLGIPVDAPMLFIIGGGLGARRVNDAVVKGMQALFTAFPALQVVHGVGRGNESAIERAYDDILSQDQRQQVRVTGFLDDVYRVSGAADVVITRAGATNLAEFAVQGKACVIVPNPVLTGGHQLKNAEYLASKQATEQVSETAIAHDPTVLANTVIALLRDPARRATLGKNFTAFGYPNAARQLAELLLNKV